MNRNITFSPLDSIIRADMKQIHPSTNILIFAEEPRVKQLFTSIWTKSWQHGWAICCAVTRNNNGQRCSGSDLDTRPWTLLAQLEQQTEGTDPLLLRNLAFFGQQGMHWRGWCRTSWSVGFGWNAALEACVRLYPACWSLQTIVFLLVPKIVTPSRKQCSCV